jgi:transglutaminase-like putative cysteine protease
MLIEVIHTTELSYDRDISQTVMELRLQPSSDATQRCHQFDLRMEPTGHLSSGVDPFGSIVHHYNFRPVHRRVVATAHSVIETGLASAVLTPELWRYQFLAFDGPVLRLPQVDEVANEVRPTDPTDPTAIEWTLGELTRHVHQRFAYRPGLTEAHSTIVDLVSYGAGVCQDFAHFWIAACRAMGIAARYVSGYIAEARAGDGPDWTAPGVSSGASHAWGEAWVPGRGWVGYDPTNPLSVTDYHVKVAVGRDYRDAAPTKGVFLGPAREEVRVQVQTRILAGRAGVGG